MYVDRRAIWTVGFVVFGFGIPGNAQQPRRYSKEEYSKAEKFMPYNIDPLAYVGMVRAKWLEDGRFWYRDYASDGWFYVIVNPANKTKAPAFDQEKLAAALKAASAGEIKDDARHLAITDLAFPKNATEHPTELLVGLGARQFRCNLDGAGTCTAVKIPGPPEEQSKENDHPRIPLPLSPDKKKVAFIRDFNLWVRDIATGQEIQLTTDGVKDYAYATDNAGWKQSDKPILLWSPDSKKIATISRTSEKSARCIWCRLATAIRL